MTTQNHLDAFALAQALRERLTRYSLDTFYFQDQEFSGGCGRGLERHYGRGWVDW